ncbi:MAG TPA: PilZ domain-containing protein [Polyangiaceae bacterium]|jgi:hypothetical protein
MSTEDRRAPGALRIPFDGLVEVGGALGPSFEAQCVNLSEEGMLLRTAYLPEAGQPLTCRFDAGPGQNVLASGEVVWAQGAERGGEFAIRFTEMDADSVEALRRACGVAEDAPAPVQAGSKVRLHIEGLASPMRAKIKDAHSTEITVGSDLGFLQVGKQLELEDAQSGSKRPACIDRVEVAVDPASHVPQLVVTLRYADVQADVEAARGAPSPGSEEGAASEAREADDRAAVEEASIRMKGTLARNIARIGPAVERFAQRAKTTIALLARRRGDDAASPRRTTAPPPGGGLHTSGRRVVRGEASMTDEAGPRPKLKITRRKAAIAGAVMVTAIVGAMILKKAHHDPAAEGAVPPQAAVATTAAAAETTPAFATPPPLPAPTPPAIDTGTSFGAMPPSMGSIAADDGSDGSPRAGHKKHGKATPFGNGPVHHGNMLHIKMDGPIEALEGAQQPTGFAVKIPGRKSLEAAGPLASRDSRIAAIKVSNDPAGAELTVAFKDGVPNYQVSAHGDTLVIALAPEGALTVAKKDEKGGKSPKHARHEHDGKKNDKR